MLSIKGNQMCIRSYKKIIEICDHKVVVDCEGCRLSMLGENFHIIALEKTEMHMEGRLHSLQMVYEK